MTAFRAILIITLAVAALGAIAGSECDKRPCLGLFIASGALFLLPIPFGRM